MAAQQLEPPRQTWTCRAPTLYPESVVLPLRLGEALLGTSPPAGSAMRIQALSWFASGQVDHRQRYHGAAMGTEAEIRSFSGTGLRAPPKRPLGAHPVRGSRHVPTPILGLALTRHAGCRAGPRAGYS